MPATDEAPDRTGNTTGQDIRKVCRSKSEQQPEADAVWDLWWRQDRRRMPTSFPAQLQNGLDFERWGVNVRAHS